MSFLQKAIGFLLLPLYTTYLLPSQFGEANVVMASTAIFIMFFSLALDDAVARYYFILKSKPETRAIFLGSIVIFTLLISIFGSAFIFIFRETIFKLFVNDDVSATLISLGIVSIATAPLYTIQQKINIIDEKPLHYTLNTLSFFLLNTFFCILFIVKYEMGAIGLLLSAAIVNVVFFIYSLLYLKKRMKFLMKWVFVKEALIYSLPLVPNRISSWGLVSFNNIYIGKLLSNSFVGIYNIANYFGVIINVIASSVSLAFQPFVYKMIDRGEDGRETLQKVIILLIAMFGFSGFIITLFSNNILEIFINEQYSSAKRIIPFVIWGATASAISSSYIYVLFYYKETTKYISYASFINATINIVGCIFLLPILDILGAVIALLIGNISSSVYIYYIVKKFSTINIPVKKAFFSPILLFIISISLQSYEVHFFVKLSIVFLLMLFIVFLKREELQILFTNKT